jgi:hypothetical protein
MPDTRFIPDPPEPAYWFWVDVWGAILAGVCLWYATGLLLTVFNYLTKGATS